MVVQQGLLGTFEYFGDGGILLGNPLQEGDVIVVGTQSNLGSILTPTDSNFDMYIPITTGTIGSGGGTFDYGLFYFVVGSGGIPAGLLIDLQCYGYHRSCNVFVLRGDGLAFDNFAVISGSAGDPMFPISLTTTNIAGNNEWIGVLVPTPSGSGLTYGKPSATRWTPLAAEAVGSSDTGYGLGGGVAQFVFKRRVSFPAMYSMIGLADNTEPWAVVMFGFKSTSPASVTKSLGDIIDLPTHELVRQQGRAYGLSVALTMDAQQKGIDWMNDLYYAVDASPFWSGDKLKCFPRAEASAVGNGSVYISPTAPGPIYELSTFTGDFISDEKSAPIMVSRKGQAIDAPNVYQIQIPSRDNGYNNVTISQPLAGATALYGTRKNSPKLLTCVASLTVARKLVALEAQRAQLNRNVVKFKANTRYQLGEPGDLWLVSDPEAGIFGVPVRPTSIEEDENYILTVEADQFVYGENVPNAVTSTDPIGSGGNLNGDPGSANPPVIFVPPNRLENNELTIIVSGSSANYGGCIVMASTDGWKRRMKSSARSTETP